MSIHLLLLLLLRLQRSPSYLVYYTTLLLLLIITAIAMCVSSETSLRHRKSRSLTQAYISLLKIRLRQRRRRTAVLLLLISSISPSSLSSLLATTLTSTTTLAHPIKLLATCSVRLTLLVIRIPSLIQAPFSAYRDNIVRPSTYKSLPTYLNLYLRVLERLLSFNTHRRYTITTITS